MKLNLTKRWWYPVCLIHIKFSLVFWLLQQTTFTNTETEMVKAQLAGEESFASFARWVKRRKGTATVVLALYLVYCLQSGVVVGGLWCSCCSRRRGGEEGLVLFICMRWPRPCPYLGTVADASRTRWVQVQSSSEEPRRRLTTTWIQPITTHNTWEVKLSSQFSVKLFTENVPVFLHLGHDRI